MTYTHEHEHIFDGYTLYYGLYYSVLTHCHELIDMTYTHEHAHIFVDMYVRMCVCARARLSVCLSVCTHVHIHVHVHIHIHIHIYTYIYIYVYKDIRICICISGLVCICGLQLRAFKGCNLGLRLEMVSEPGDQGLTLKPQYICHIIICTYVTSSYVLMSQGLTLKPQGLQFRNPDP